MTDLLAWARELLVANQGAAAVVITAVTGGESVAVVGTVVPATPFMLLAGGLVGAKALSPWVVIPASIVGAAVGATLSYWIGRWLGPLAWRRPPFRGRRRQVARARLMIRRFGTASLMIGRFTGPLWSVIPVLAGMLGMQHRRFQVANIVSAVVWTVVMLAPGWLIARGVRLFQDLG